MRIEHYTNREIVGRFILNERSNESSLEVYYTFTSLGDSLQKSILFNGLLNILNLFIYLQGSSLELS